MTVPAQFLEDAVDHVAALSASENLALEQAVMLVRDHHDVRHLAPRPLPFQQVVI
jgi:hypothetical protein